MPSMRAALPAVRRLRQRRSVLVAGHGVADVAPEHDPENLCVAPDRFRAQLELLLGAGFEFVTVAELARVGAGARPRPGLLALSFDDGMENNLSVVAPMLREHGVPATVYVATGLMGEANPWIDPAAGARMMTPDEVVELDGAGWEIGAHTVTHADLSQRSAAECEAEVTGSRDALQALLGHPVETFAYPYFRYGPEALAAVRAAGFRAAVTGGGRGAWSPFELERAMITGRDGLPSFLAKLAGVYEPLHGSRTGERLRAITRAPRQGIRALGARRGGRA